MALSWYLVKGEKDRPDNRCRKWRVVVRRKGGGTRSSTFHGTKTDARKWAPTFAAEVEAERGPCGRTLGEVATAWNDARLASGEIGPSSHANYCNAVKAYKAVCALDASEVTTESVNDETARLMASHAPSTVRLYRMLMGRAMDEAVKRGVADSNAFSGSSSPRARREEREVLPPDKVREVLSWDASDTYRFFVSLVLRTGMRRGEALGVTWGDFDGSSIRVRRAVTKTDSGARTIPLDPDTARYVSERKAMLEGLNGEVPDCTPIACGPTLETARYETYGRHWSRISRELGCEGLRLHDLRHTYLTNLAQAGVHPSVMQRLAGHSTPVMSLQVYTHVNDGDLASAVAAMARARAGC